MGAQLEANKYKAAITKKLSFSFSFQFFTRLAAVFAEEVDGPRTPIIFIEIVSSKVASTHL
tara:strand:+ start:20 stop:202 length:183 start_codon:yes stop_codon:yes gene_type:complete